MAGAGNGTVARTEARWSGAIRDNVQEDPVIELLVGRRDQDERLKIGNADIESRNVWEGGKTTRKEREVR